MTIRIVTDSTSDLPASLRAEYDITVVPVYINIGSQSYLDGVELQRHDFYRQLPTYDTHPTTAAPSTGQFAGIYEQLTQDGAEAIISIHIAGALSSTLNAARLGAQQANSAPVHLIDSGSLTMGLGFLVLEAAKMAREGHQVNAILNHLEALKQRTHVFAMLDTLEYLRRSGRVNWAQFGLGTLLSIKPIAKIHQGVVDLERIRTQRRAQARTLELLQEKAPLQHLAVLHISNPLAAADLQQQAQEKLGITELPPIVEVTPAIGSHLGPGAVGFACVAQDPRRDPPA